MSVLQWILHILLYILAAAVALLVLFVFSKITFSFRYNNTFTFTARLWFMNFNITKFISRSKKTKAPRIIHFSGEHFGEIPDTKSKKTNKQAQKQAQTSNHLTTSPKQSKKSVSEVLDLLRELINDSSEPLGKCARLKIKKLRATAASENPDTTAIMFGHLNTAAGAVLLAAQKYKNLEVCDKAVGVYSDFLAVKPSLDADIQLEVKTRYAILTAYNILKSYLKNK